MHSKTVAGHAQMGGQLTSIMGLLQKLVTRDETGVSAAKSISAKIVTPLKTAGGEGEKDTVTPDIDASGQGPFDEFTTVAPAEAEKSLSLAGFQTPTARSSKEPATDNPSSRSLSRHWDPLGSPQDGYEEGVLSTSQSPTRTLPNLIPLAKSPKCDSKAYRACGVDSCGV